jgi:hypothetical protein
MKDSDWEKLFALIDQVVNLEGLSANEKADLLKSKAAEFDATTNLDEFSAYCSADL